MTFENNDDLRRAVKNNLLDCNGEGLVCGFDIDVDADIVNCGKISACDISAWSISAGDISASGDISAGDILARDIYARGNISAGNILARDISAGDILARDIFYYGYCIAYNNISCKSIKGRRRNSFHKALDGTIKKVEKK